MPTLKEMLGDSYKEGMSFDEVATFFEGKNYADLSTGAYVDKNKFDNQVNSLTKQLNETKSQLNAKLTDDEKNAEASKQQADRIKELENLLKDNTVASNKTIVNNTMTGSRDILGLDANDKDYLAFVDNVTTEDSNKTTSIINYVSKLVKDSYEKGKQDALKDEMGNFGKNKGQGSSSKETEIGKLGKELADLSKDNKETFDYFKIGGK